MAHSKSAVFLHTLYRATTKRAPRATVIRADTGNLMKPYDPVTIFVALGMPLKPRGTSLYSIKEE